jgi:hemolysin III
VAGIVTPETPRATLGPMQNPVRGLLHGSAALLSIAGAALLQTHAGAGGAGARGALLVFGASLVTLFGVSSLYHSVPWRPVWKRRLQRADHAMIYVLIAGTYTPMAAIVLDGWLRGATLAVAWGIAAIGVAQKVWWPRVRHRYSVALQALQGWLAVALLAPLSERLSGPALALLIAGGLLYTLGLVAFATRRPRLWPRVFSYHEVFHVLVVAGGASHWALAFAYVAPFAAP